MNKTMHLISNAHLDPIWQWEWEEGCASAVATFRCAARFCRVCLLAPLAEEGVFRGAVQRRAQPLGRGQAILLQAVLFALQHGSAAAMAYALVCGLGLGWLADRTGHLWPGVLLHSANNLLVLAMG